MLPISGINGSIPLGILLGLSSYSALFWSMLGSSISVGIAYKILDPVVNFLMKRFNFLDKKIKKLFEKIHHKHSKKFNEIGIVMLGLFVTLPLPGTGAYTAILIAYLFNAPFWPSLIAITMGHIVRGLILVGGISGFTQMAHFFQL